MIRIFTALEIPGYVIDKLYETRKSICDDETNFRWEPKEKIHVTLKFIGDVDQKLLNELIKELSFLESFKKLNAELFNFGFFYRDGSPVILRASLKLDSTADVIVTRLNDELMKFGIKKEKRKFTPHLTLLRIKKNPGQDFINSFAGFNFEPIKFQADTITLFKSELKKTGSQYFEIKKYKLN